VAEDRREKALPIHHHGRSSAGLQRFGTKKSLAVSPDVLIVKGRRLGQNTLRIRAVLGSAFVRWPTRSIQYP
jgi:hypothetical protein